MTAEDPTRKDPIETELNLAAIELRSMKGLATQIENLMSEVQEAYRRFPKSNEPWERSPAFNQFITCHTDAKARLASFEAALTRFTAQMNSTNRSTNITEAQRTKWRELVDEHKPYIPPVDTARVELFKLEKSVTYHTGHQF